MRATVELAPTRSKKPPITLTRRFLQMWALLPLCAELETTDNLMLSYWISVEQQRYSECGWMTRNTL